MLPELDQLFGRIAVEQRFISREQLEECQSIYETVSKLGVKRSLQDILVDKGYLTNNEVLEILRGLVKEGVRPRLGNFEILSKIGEGGMGAVYKARQLSLDRIVALKVLPPRLARDSTFVRRFFREAKTAGKLAHPNVITTLDVGESGGFYYIAMEFIEGPTVAELIQQEGKIAEPKATDIVAGVAAGLAYAARHNIIHRDIKPSNIMIASDGKAKLCDLGLAKQLFVDDASLTESGAAVGTPHYMSPEQAQGRSDVDGRSDIYSLGATYFHMLTGRQPFTGDTPLEILHQRLKETPPSPRALSPGLSDGVCEVVQKMMARDLKDRYQTAEELLADLNAVRSGLATPTLPGLTRARRGKHISQEIAAQQRFRQRLWIAGVAAGALTLAVLILFVVLLVIRKGRQTPIVAASPQQPTITAAPSQSVPPKAAAPSLAAPAVAATPAPPTAAAPGAAQTPAATPENQAQLAEKAYLDAVAFESRHEKDYKGQIDRWQEVMRLAPNSNFVEIAKSHLSAAQEALRNAPPPQTQSAMDKAEALSAQRKFGEAIKLLQSLNAEGAAASQVAEMIQVCNQKAAANFQKVKREAQTLADLERYDTARAVLQEVAALGPQSLTQKANEEIAQIALRESTRRNETDQARLHLYQGLTDQLNAYLGRQDFAGAESFLNKAQDSAQNQSVARLLAADKAAVAVLAEFHKAAQEGAKQLMGKDITISGIRGTLNRVEDNTLNLSSGAGSFDKKIKDLRPEDILTLVAHSNQKDLAADPFRRGIFYLYTGQLPRAKKDFDVIVVPADREKIAPYSDRLALLSMSARGDEASRLFDQAQRLFASEKYKEALPLLSRISQEYADALWLAQNATKVRTLFLLTKSRSEQADEMVAIPAGRFIYQKNEDMSLTAFALDRYEVSNAQYALFLEYLSLSADRSFCHPQEPPNKDHTPLFWTDAALNKSDLPVVGVDWFDAYAFAQYAGKRLPTETEWEKAARGLKGFRFPWGDTNDPKRWIHSGAGSPFQGLAPVASLPSGKSSFGCYQMLGNVEEWTASWFDETDGTRVVRGGSWQSTEDADLLLREARKAAARTKYTGFRCAK